jgi:hypothetical protein
MAAGGRLSEQLINQLAQSGVLGAVLVWFMLRLEGILKENTKTLADLTIAITKLVDKMSSVP